MPTIIGSKSGTRPFLELDWSISSQDIANNRSNVNLKLYLRVTSSSIGYSARYTGTLQGASFTSQSGYISTSGRFLLAERNIWIGHNSNGTKTQTFTADYNLNMTWGGTYFGKISLSGQGTLTTIPRGSTLSAFNFANSLQIGTANTINYTVTRYSGNFRHHIQLRDGSVTIATWDNVSSNGSNTLSLTGTQVNTLLDRMSTVTSKSFTLRVATRSGVNGGWIGSAVTRNASVSVNANVTPQINSTSAKPIGNSWAVGKGFYVQGQTGVQAEFSSSVRGGAGVRSRNISIGGLSSGGSVVGSVFRHSQSRVSTTGNITITYTITDTRGRTASDKRVVNFRAYTPPQITDFTSDRASTTSSTVSVKSKGSIHGMGGQNTGTMTVTQKGISGNVRSLSLSNTTPSFNDSFNRTVATASSAEFTITVRDSLGNSASAVTSVGTAFMEFSIKKGTGVGIGKVYERGVLDVDGAAYFKGVLTAQIDDTGSALRVQSDLLNGHGYVGYFASNGTRRGYVGFGATNNNHFNIANEHGSDGDIRFIPGSGRIRVNWDDVVGRGSNSNGQWVRFYDGTQICWHRMNAGRGPNVAQGSVYHSGNTVWNFPMEFIAEASTTAWYTTAAVVGTSWAGLGSGATSAIRSSFTVYRGTSNGSVPTVSCTAIGRWK